MSGVKEGHSLALLNLGTYPPKKCGIASFSYDLRESLLQAGSQVYVAAVSEGDVSYDYPQEVIYRLTQEQRVDYGATARLINASARIDAVIIQHEYGIFGGADGEYILDFVAQLKKPYVLVAHTVLPHPSPNQRAVLARLTLRAAATVCMTRRSARLLARTYAVPPRKVFVIPHGVPAFVPQDRELLKAKYGLVGRDVVTTFGLIGPGKGLENGIRAVAQLVDRYPSLMYWIAGGTHPVLLRREGERYREMLVDLVQQLGLEKHVTFVNHFLELDELGDYLYMTDIYLSPYPNRDQAVSGTLAYAMGCGRAIVSTPYEYALELLAGGQRGLVAAATTPEAIAVQMERLLAHPEFKRQLELHASEYGRTLSWSSVAGQYVALLDKVVRVHQAEVTA
jgi:glycosyltransferase involved in cell wall biosynthesis